jgi:hypothetical protein
VPSGTVTVTSELPGFSTGRRSFAFDQRARQLDFRMEVAGLVESLNVTADAVNNLSALNVPVNAAQAERPSREAQVQVAPSQNVINLQRRVAGVLPVRVDVPRAGTQYRFMRPLVLEEETTVSFRYKTR